MLFINNSKEAILCFFNSVLLDNKSYLEEAFKFNQWDLKITIFYLKYCLKLTPNLFSNYIVHNWESGSTARNASARISTARQFFQKCHLLDRKKYAVRVPRVNFEQLIKKLHLLEFSSR